MARRRMTKRRTRRRKSGFNIVNAAELYLTTDVLTRNFMGTTPLGFFTGQEMGTLTTGVNQFGKANLVQGMGYFPTASSVTLPELLGFDARRQGAPQASVPLGGINGLNQIKANVTANAIPAIMQYAGVKIGFTIGKRLLRKQRSFINNKILQPIGLKSTVVV